MGTVVFKCDLVNIGHNWLNGEPASFTVYKASGAFPASAAAYDVTSATFALSNAGAVVRQSGTGTKLQIVGGAVLLDDGAWLGGGTGALAFSISALPQLATLNSCTLKLSGGWQLTSGSTCTITVNYLEKVSKISAVTKAIMDAGQTQTVTIAANSAAFTHKLIYSLGNESVTRSMAAGATSDSWVVPLTWLNQMQNAAAATVSLALQTYAGGVLTGTTYGAFTLTCPAGIVPTIGATTAVPNGTTTIGAGVFVKGKTGVTASMSGVAVSYATLAATGISVGGYGAGYAGSGTSLSTGTLPQSGTVRVTFWAKDSRGRTGYAYRDIAVKDYALPSLSRAAAYRVLADGTTSPTGTQGMFAFELTRSAPGGSYWTKVEVMRAGAVLASFTAVSGSGKIVTGAGSTTPLTVAPESEYEIVFRVSDSYVTAGMLTTVVLPSAMAAISINKEFDAVGFGKIAQKHKAVELGDDWEMWYKGKALWDKLFPVGYVYMSVVSTSPASLFGGTWERIQDRFMLAAGSVYAAGSKGGAAEVALTAAQMPKHSHTNAGIPNNQGYTWAAPYQRVGYVYTADNPYPANVVTSSAGGNEPHDNMPPFEAVYVWKRTA